MTNRANKGFTIIEVMIACAFVIILTAVSMSYYGEYIKRGYRVDAQNALMQLANAMERWRTENNVYDTTHTGSVPNTNFFPSTVPLGGNSPQYSLTIATASANEYELTATPITGARMDGDTIYYLSYTGKKEKDDGTGRADGWEED